MRCIDATTADGLLIEPHKVATFSSPRMMAGRRRTKFHPGGSGVHPGMEGAATVHYQTTQKLTGQIQANFSTRVGNVDLRRVEFVSLFCYLYR